LKSHACVLACGKALLQAPCRACTARAAVSRRGGRAQTWPEAQFPLARVGSMVLNQNPGNFFNDNEQLALSPGHVVPGARTPAAPQRCAASLCMCWIACEATANKKSTSRALCPLTWAAQACSQARSAKAAWWPEAAQASRIRTTSCCSGALWRTTMRSATASAPILACCRSTARAARSATTVRTGDAHWCRLDDCIHHALCSQWTRAKLGLAADAYESASHVRLDGMVSQCCHARRSLSDVTAATASSGEKGVKRSVGVGIDGAGHG